MAHVHRVVEDYMKFLRSMGQETRVRLSVEVAIVERGGFEANEAKRRLYEEMDRDGRRVVGLKLKWVPEVRGVDNPVALVQTATERFCVLWRVCRARTREGGQIPAALRELLLDRTVTKAGCGIDEDRCKLERFGVTPRPYQELQQMYRRVYALDLLERPSLSSMARCLLGDWFRIEEPGRGGRQSRAAYGAWDAASLSEEQVRCAVTDAWTCLQLWVKLSPLWRRRKREQLQLADERSVEGLAY